MIKTTPVDLSRAVEHECPGIIEGDQVYLAKIGGEFYVGRFGRQWFGLDFDGKYDGVQFDAPGYNHSDWEALWALDEVEGDVRDAGARHRNSLLSG